MRVELLLTKTVQHYTEGPAVDAEGNVYCTTLTGGSILRLDRENYFSAWAATPCPNGQVILANGDHLVCDSSTATIVRFNERGKFLRNEMQGICDGVKVRVPNDLVEDAHGGLYFTDSILDEGKVFYISAHGAETLVADGLHYPNGLVLSRDSRTLLVAESYKNRILSISLASAGVAAGGSRLLCNLPQHVSGKIESNLPDGMALDDHNRIWVAHYGMQALQVLTMQGELVCSIAIPFPLASNVFFSPSNPAELIVTGGYAEPGPGALVKLLIIE